MIRQTGKLKVPTKFSRYTVRIYRMQYKNLQDVIRF